MKIFFCVVILFLFRLWLLFSIGAHSSTTLLSDDALYMDMARSIHEGNWWRAIHPTWLPIYPFFTSLLYPLFGNWAFTGRIVSAVAGSLLFIPLYLLTARWIGRKYAYLVAIPLFLDPFIDASLMPLTESLLMLFFWSGLTCLFLANGNLKKHKYLLILGGFFMALATLTKSEAMLGFLASLGYLSITTFQEIVKRKSLSTLLPILLFILGFLSLYLPYQLMIYQKYHTNVSSAKLIAILKINSPFDLNISRTSSWIQDIDSLDTYNPHSEFSQGSVSILWERRVSYYHDWLIRMKLVLAQIGHYVGVPFIILVLLFLTYAFIGTKDRKHFYALISIGFVSLSTTFLLSAAYESRYIYWTFPFISIGIIISVTTFINRYVKKNYLKILFMLLIMTTLLSWFYGNTAYTLPTIKENPTLPMFLTGKRVMVEHEGMVFDQRSFIVYTPLVHDLSQLTDYAQRWKVDYLIARPGEVPSQLDFLYTQPQDYSPFQVVYQQPEKRTVIYKYVSEKE